MDAASRDGRDEEEEEEYEEGGGGNRLLGFMLGNVDNTGDLDVDYLHEDAKEHLSALADKLGPSLTDMDLIKSSPATTDASEQDYDEKAEDAIDYEDIDEQYDGPGIQVATEEDHLLPRKEYFLSDALLSTLNSKTSVFDEDDYDEDDEIVKEKIKENINEIESLPLAGGDLEMVPVKPISFEENFHSGGSLESKEVAFEPEIFQEDQLVPDAQANPKSENSLPVLCVEDGMAILRFSEIFGVHKPLKKADKRYHKRSSFNEWDKTFDIMDITEEDEEAFLRSSGHDLFITRNHRLAVFDGEEDIDQAICYVDEQNKDIHLSSLPMKDDTPVDVAFQCSLLSPKFYPLDQQDWEHEIIWGNSPQSSYGFSGNGEFSEHDTEGQSEEHSDDGYRRSNIRSTGKDSDLLSNADLADLIGSTNNSMAYQQY